MYRRNFLASLGVGALALVCGCKPKAPYDLVPVSGTVKYKGQPLDERFHVEFTPTDGTRPSMCKLDSEGNFEAIHTASQKGVKPGTNRVIVYWNEDPTTTPIPEEYQEMFSKYGFTGSEQLEVEISKKEKNFEVNYE